MSISLFALASSDWGVARFITDSIALITLGILIYLPFTLLKDKFEAKSLKVDGNAFSNRPNG